MRLPVPCYLAGSETNNAVQQAAAGGLEKGEVLQSMLFMCAKKHSQPPS